MPYKRPTGIWGTRVRLSRMERGRDHGSEIDVLMMPYHEISLDPLERWLNALWLGYMCYGGLTVVAETGRRIGVRIAPYSHVESSTFVISQD